MLDKIRATLALSKHIDHAVESVEGIEDGLPLPSRIFQPRSRGGFGLRQAHPTFVNEFREIRCAAPQSFESRRFGLGLFLQSLRVLVGVVERLCTGHDEVGDLWQPAENRPGLSNSSSGHLKFIF